MTADFFFAILNHGNKTDELKSRKEGGESEAKNACKRAKGARR